MSDATKVVGEQLRDPFPLDALGWKPQAVKGNRALAVAYIDARDVMQRLDDAVGVENWQDEYFPLDGGQVMCKLSVCFDGKWVTKCDVGGESEQPDKGDREKAAFSDALKRAAVKFGIGRYLYSMPSQWCDYDPLKKQFKQTPRVAPQFLPRVATPAKAPPAPNPDAAFEKLCADARAAFTRAADSAALFLAWNPLPDDVKAATVRDKDARKAALAPKAAPAGPKSDPSTDEPGGLFDAGGARHPVAGLDAQRR
jgi:hypothetical protein